MDVTANTLNATDGTSAPRYHDEVAKRLGHQRRQGTRRRRSANRLRKYGPNRLPEAKKRGPFVRFLRSSTTSSSMSCSAPASPSSCSACGSMRASSSAWYLTGCSASSQEGKAEKALDSIRNCVVRRSTGRRAAARPHDPGGRAGAWLRVVLARIRRQGACRPAPRLNSKEPAHRGSGAHGRIGSRRKRPPIGPRENPPSGTRSACFLRDDGSCRAARPGSWSPLGARPNSARSTNCSRVFSALETPVAAADQESRLPDHRRGGRGGGRRVRLWPLGDGHGVSSSCSRRSSHCGVAGFRKACRR